ncbi:NUDIX hydrolase [Kineosporia sp. J2-2]|uniref:NUDIX hydrolase n=1 Tax=Kineosporia corallincola TaxID=2835133 RepID=A0ABS5TBV0_9ACTN|nr:NUDIX hydrolase [Kineosporia corallincola]MBT0768552.1 NUDIX hydrolase [Kineosporia corallincola]
MDIRVTGILTDDQGRLLLLDQDTDSGRSWSLPGGKVELGETLAGALVREMREETGLVVEPDRLLYVCDYLPGGDKHVVHMTFETQRTGGDVGDVTVGADTSPIRGVQFVPVADLASYGFSERFRELAEAGWPQAGSYMGPKSAIGL